MLCIKKGLDVFRKLGLMVLVVARFQYSSMLNPSGRSLCSFEEKLRNVKLLISFMKFK